MTNHKEHDALLHILRNPHGWSEDTVRDARLRAADELERLWVITLNAKALASELVQELRND